jgi:tetratricopeptide (TPR) repeat protein
MAHAALGSLFLQQHEYPEAVPELEKATILSPDNADLQVGLGRAYLNTGERDKALAAFDKGAGLSQAPVVWNDIAYNLADSHIELDRAQQYAESAVSATAANLRNIDLKSLTPQQLGQVTAIGAFWDTLGWVYFQKGDLQKASRYITAGWLLDQHGEVGDHLAQIYDKLGDKDRAIHAYALALAAPHSVPETRARLTLLLKGNAGIDDLVNKARPELVSARSFVLKGLSKEDATADFLILLSPAGADGSSVKIEAVKFLSGSDALQSFVDQLRSLDYHTVFPDASPVKLVRRGTLSCSAKTGDCTFTLARPEDVRAVN